MLTEILGGVGLVSNLIGGFLGKSAAKKAADAQVQSTIEAQNKISDTISAVNPTIIDSANRVGTRAREAAATAGAGVKEATTGANALLQPYIDTGVKANTTLSNLLDTTGRQPTLEELQMDPGYAFRTAEAEKAIQGRAAQLGLATGGGVLKALTKYRGAEASQEYANAFERFRKLNSDRISLATGLSNQGQNAAGEAGSNLFKGATYAGDAGINAEQFAGNKDYDAINQVAQNSIGGAQSAADLILQRGNARASGIVGGTNALTGGISGGVNAVTSAATLRLLLKDPALSRMARNSTTLRGIGGTGIG